MDYRQVVTARMHGVWIDGQGFGLGDSFKTQMNHHQLIVTAKPRATDVEKAH